MKNLDEVFRWYTDVLGFKLSGEVVSNEDGRWCLLATTSGDNHLALWQPSRTDASTEKEQQSFVPVFEVFGLPDFVGCLAREGVSVLEEIRDRKDYAITTIADPEGHRLQLFEWRK
ncbi:MAG: VOC family protein [bacterium]